MSGDDLRVREIRVLRGPNLWRPAPVVACALEVGRRGIAAAEEVARAAVELQAAVGARVAFHRAAPADEEGAAWAVVEYTEEALGVEAVREAAALVGRRPAGEDEGREAALARLREVYRDARPGPTISVVMEAARRRGIPVRRIAGEEVVQLGLGRNLRRLDATMTDSTSVIATDLTSHKDRTKRVLRRWGLPVPDGAVARTVEEALAAVARLGFPVLLKPLDSHEGKGISGPLDGLDAVRGAWERAAAEHPQVVVERWIAGRDHRVVVVDGRVVAVAERVPAHVVGDGRRTVRELAEEINRDPRRDRYNPDQTLVPLPLDELTAACLARGGRTLDTVPAAGERVQLRSTANVSTGGTSVDRTDEIHPRNAALCALAVAAVGLDIAGIDVLTPDISVPFGENGATIIEVNASPGIRMHTHPDEGAPRDVPGAVLDMLYPPGAEAAIPIVAVAGTRGTAEAAREIARRLRRPGRCVGCATAEGFFLDGERLLEGDYSGARGAGLVLSHPGVDLAVLDTPAEDVRRSGLGFEACDVAVVLDREDEAVRVVAGVVKPGGTVIDLAGEVPPAPGAANP